MNGIVFDIMREDIVSARREKLDRVMAEFGEAYPEKAHRTQTNAEALSDFESLAKQEIPVSLVGRVRSFRNMGKIAMIFWFKTLRKKASNPKHSILP